MGAPSVSGTSQELWGRLLEGRGSFLTSLDTSDRQVAGPIGLSILGVRLRPA
jgi:hypothetical protein